MNKSIIKCPKCGENLVFTQGDQSELNYNFVEKHGEQRSYIWPKNITTFAQEPSNRQTMRRLLTEKAEAEKAENRRVVIHRNTVIHALQGTHRGTLKRLSVDLDTPLTLTCKCGSKQIVGGAGEVC